VAGPVTDPRAGVLRAPIRRCSQNPELPVPVHRIAEDLLGLHIATADLEELSGALYPAEREIRVNITEPETPATHTPSRGRTLGVPLSWRPRRAGLLPPPGLGQVGRPGARVEANVFAAELVMPEPEVREVLAQHRDVREVAAVFGVSPLTMRWRFYSFELVDAPPA
jgi:IrrE N-terminal-like domain